MLLGLKLTIQLELYALSKYLDKEAKRRRHCNYLPKPATKAFTLAEVLITLLIIGVVSSIVIPVIINETQDAELNTALKKVYAELSVATKQIIFENGGTFVGIMISDSDDTGIKNTYASHLNHIKSCNNARNEGCWHPFSTNGGTWINLGGLQTDGNSTGSGLTLNNGTLVTFVPLGKNCTYKGGYYTKSALCSWIIVDINGFKRPNVTGKDVFYFNLLSNKLEPWGSPDSLYQTCSAQTNAGLYCTASKLMQ